MPQSKGKQAGVRAALMDARRTDEPASARGSSARVAGSASAHAAPRAATQAVSNLTASNQVSARVTAQVRAVAPGSTAQVAPSSTAQVAPSSRCEVALLRVLQEAGLLQQVEPLAPTERAEALRRALQQLEPEMALKIRALLVAGRDGQRIEVAAGASLVAGDTSGSASTVFSSLTIDADETGPRLVDDLRRGHAIACAMDIDVDSPIAHWRAPLSPDLDERAWLSFGKQLAGGKPGDWQGFAVPEAPAQGFRKIYLKLGDNAWWSFQAMLDRPTPAGFAKERRALSKRRLKGVSVQTLEALAGKLGNSQGRALRRASRAIRARVGQLGPAPAPLRK